METVEPVSLEVCHALPMQQSVLRVDVTPGSTVEEAIRASGILALYPGIELDKNRVGVHGKLCGLERIVEAGDRIEIYRPLVGDPKEIRRKLAAQGQVMGES